MKLKTLIALLLGIALFFTLVLVAGAQEKKKKKESLDRVDGTIQTLNKDTKTLSVRLRAGNVQRQVVYSDDTKITNRNQPDGTVDQLKEGTRIICLGKYNDKTQLVAARIDIRQSR